MIQETLSCLTERINCGGSKEGKKAVTSSLLTEISYVAPIIPFIIYTADKLWFNLLLHCAIQFLFFILAFLAHG